MVEPSLFQSVPEEVFQFERVGYFVADKKDHMTEGCPVFNQTVPLKDSWGKNPRK